MKMDAVSRPQTTCFDFCTCEWQAVNTLLLMILHCFWAQDCLYGFDLHGSLVTSALGQLGDTFQLFPNSKELITTAWLLVVKSLFPLPS